MENHNDLNIERLGTESEKIYNERVNFIKKVTCIEK